MNYTIKAHSNAGANATILINENEIDFGITSDPISKLSSPAELFLGAFSSCILKNVERFAGFMHFDYSRAEISVSATRLEKPPRIDDIHYELKIFSNDAKLNINLLKKNIEKFGTIFNTVQTSCTIKGEILKISD